MRNEIFASKLNYRQNKQLLQPKDVDDERRNSWQSHRERKEHG